MSQCATKVLIGQWNSLWLKHPLLYHWGLCVWQDYRCAITGHLERLHYLEFCCAPLYSVQLWWPPEIIPSLWTLLLRWESILTSR